MLDKDSQRRRRRPAPQGRLPTWRLVLVAGALAAVALIARSLV